MDGNSVLFAEELGIVIEYQQKHERKIRKILEEKGLPYQYIGKTTRKKTITISVNSDEVLNEDMMILRGIWEETSHQLDRLQRNPASLAALLLSACSKEGASSSARTNAAPTAFGNPLNAGDSSYGNTAPVDHESLFMSRKIALAAGLPEDSSALGVVRACGSGSQAIVSAAQQIMSGHSEIAVACGGENFSRVPYLSHALRWGAGRGPSEFVDGLDYIYRCPFTRELMGETAENLTARFGYTREAMDEWGLMSQQRAGAARTSGFLARQIAPIEVPEGRGGRRVFEHDELPRPPVTREKLASLC